MSRRFVFWPTLALCMVVLSATWATAGMVSTSDGNGADTFISNDSNSGPDDIHGADETAEVRHLGTLSSSGPPDFLEIYSGVRSKIMMLRFDLSGTSGPRNNAMLHLTQTFGSRNRTLEVYGLNDGANDNWDEATTSYSNAPGVNPADIGLYDIDLTEATLLGTLAVPDNRQIAPSEIWSDPIDLPLDGFLAGDTNGIVTLMVAYPMPNTDSNPTYSYATKENTTDLAAPSLSWVPEPTSFALLLTSVLGICVGFRRRD